jgi:hypothetical protein
MIAESDVPELAAAVGSASNLNANLPKVLFMHGSFR